MCCDPCLDVADAVRLFLQHTGLYSTSQRLTAAVLCRVKVNTLHMVLLQNLDIIFTSETEIMAEFLVVLLYFLRNAVTPSLISYNRPSSISVQFIIRKSSHY